VLSLLTAALALPPPASASASASASGCTMAGMNSTAPRSSRIIAVTGIGL
jgi:hypothetical protein